VDLGSLQGKERSKALRSSYQKYKEQNSLERSGKEFASYID
jgi:hypothetical protein